MAKRRANDEKAIYKMSLWIMETQYKHIPEEQWEEKIKTKEIRDKVIESLTIGDLASRLEEEYMGFKSLSKCDDEASYIIKNIPKELLTNINEWLDNKPLSDIKVHGVSINDIRNMFIKNRDLNFISILNCIILWKKNNYYDNDFCRKYFARK